MLDALYTLNLFRHVSNHLIRAHVHVLRIVCKNDLDLYLIQPPGPGRECLAGKLNLKCLALCEGMWYLYILMQ